MQVWQVAGVQWFRVLHHGRDDGPRDGLVHGLRGLRLDELPDRVVAMHSLQVGVVPQHFVGQVLGDAVFYVGEGLLVAGRVLVPLLRLFLFPKLFQFFYVSLKVR